MNKTIFLIQHITGYGPASNYEVTARLLRDAGFVCCKSEKDREGKYWEVWLGYPFRINATLCGETTQEVTAWLMRNIGPGEISLSIESEHWGLGTD